MKMKLYNMLVPGMCMAAGVSLLLLASACSKKEKVSLQTATVTRGEITEAVTATGTLECITQVDVGTQVTGIVAKLFADFNSVVTEGQLIAEIDKTTLEADLQSADAQLESSRLEYEYAKKNYERDEALHQKQLISDYDYETSRRDYLVAKSDYERMQANRVSAARNLSYAEITSPMDGIVISREVEIGQTVVSNMEVANLFTIGDLDKMQVVADVDEADIGGVREGQRVTFTVDAYPEDTFTGKVMQIRLGDSSSGESSSSSSSSSTVVTYEVVISAPNPDLKLKPRLTANVNIYTLDRTDVLCVPARALRFTPSSELLGKDVTIADCEASHKVWTRQGNVLTAHPVTTGISNGTLTEILSGIDEGTEVITEVTLGTTAEASPAPTTGERSPFMPGPPDRNKNKDNEKKQ